MGGRRPKGMPPEVGDTSWMQQGSCRDHNPEAWFSNDITVEIAARQVCQGCPVKEPCLEYALENRVKGIWADTNENQRRAERGKRTRQNRKRLELTS